MNIDRFLVKINEGISSWANNPKTHRAAAIVMGFVWGTFVGVVLTLFIVAGI